MKDELICPVELYFERFLSFFTEGDPLCIF